MHGWFYDTWGYVALASLADEGHEVAAAADLWRGTHGVAAVTSDYVLDESLTALHAGHGAGPALALLDRVEALLAGRRLTLVEITADRRGIALRHFRRLAPGVPGLSFTDCTSFAVMEELGIEIAFTADGRFRRAGRGIRPLFHLARGRLAWSPPDS